MADKESSKQGRLARETHHAFHLLSKSNRRDTLALKVSPASATPIFRAQPWSLHSISETFQTHSWKDKEWLQLVCKAAWSRGFWRRLHKHPWEDIFKTYKKGQINCLPFFFWFLWQLPTNRAAVYLKKEISYREKIQVKEKRDLIMRPVQILLLVWCLFIPAMSVSFILHPFIKEKHLLTPQWCTLQSQERQTRREAASVRTCS